ncbi:ATP-dependent DNA helicase [Anoxybacillus ayderensis]|uniref:ATP-dependent helicase n=1 Tax=Anoxybacillus ayderensis TaxID=265546 RepID=UPI002E1A62F0|nr:ATP-dependent DNA helicase [Anoxybacillus ayderensis]
MKLGLNKQQKQAVHTTEGPLLIIAGPGSGKTFTLVERIKHIITTKNVNPENILVATFTEKAASELLTRISNRLNEERISINLNEMYIGTIHSICLRILEENREYTRLKKNYRVLDQFDQQYLIYQNINKFTHVPGFDLIVKEKPSKWQKAETILGWVNKLTEELVDIDKLKSSQENAIRALAEIYKIYIGILERENALDFSTIQSETVYLLKNNPDVLAKLQEKIQYLMIDEYQDTNTVQEELIFLLAGKHQNICVVGDDDQGLYRFRGATIRNILEFPDKFPNGVCEKIELSTNYRSHPTIIEFYNRWMESKNWKDRRGNIFRYEKEIKPKNGEFLNVRSVVKVSAKESIDNWFNEIYEFLMMLKNEGQLTDWNQVAFLFKSVKNPKVKALADFLESRGIPVYSPRSNAFFDREEIRLLIGAYMFMFPQISKIRKWNEEVELDIWDYCDSCVREFANQLREPENKELAQFAVKKAKEHSNLYENTDYGFTGLFYQLLQFPLFYKFIDKYDGSVHDSREARNIALFSQLLSKYEYLHNLSVLTPKNLESHLKMFFNDYLRYLRSGGINEYEDNSEYAPKGCVSFLTIHQSKGMEFPVVIVGSLDSTPKKQYNDLDIILQNKYYNKAPFEPIEQTKYYDFWRLYYTAFSRAQNVLALTCLEHKAQRRGEKNVPAKEFVHVYASLPNWRDVDLSQIKLEKVKDVNIKRQYSFTSHIGLFDMCALQYKFFKELEFSPVRQGTTVFGSLVHQTIEDIHKAVLNGEEHKITPEKIEEWFHANYMYLVQKNRVYLMETTKEAALQQIKNYVENQKRNWDKIKEAEVDVSLAKNNYILHGTIDLVQGEGNTVEIIDFKSEKKPNLFNERERIEHYRKQLEVYAHLVEERIGLEVSKMHLYYTGEQSGNPYVTFVKNSSSIDSTIKIFDKIVERIENRDFAITKRPKKHCGNCDMRFYCDSKERKGELVSGKQ